LIGPQGPLKAGAQRITMGTKKRRRGTFLLKCNSSNSREKRTQAIAFGNYSVVLNIIPSTDFFALVGKNSALAKKKHKNFFFAESGKFVSEIMDVKFLVRRVLLSLYI